MKNISKQLRYDDEFMDSKIPEEIRYLPDPNYEYPFFVHKHLLSEAECDSLVEDALDNDNRVAASVGSGRNVHTGIRKTDVLMPGSEYRSLYIERNRSIKPEVEKFFGMNLVDTGEVQAFGYPPSGHYSLHADDSVRMYNEDGELTHWAVTNPIRKISCILFLTDSVMSITGPNQCVGGNLSFDFLFDEKDAPFLVEPKKGTYFAFPSNPYFSHRVHEVYDGYRVVIVNWFGVQS